ncbi:MAG: hypothetical protein AAGF27_06425 [Pseudomonadota bacterium]
MQCDGPEDAHLGRSDVAGQGGCARRCNCPECLFKVYYAHVVDGCHPAGRRDRWPFSVCPAPQTSCAAQTHAPMADMDYAVHERVRAISAESRYSSAGIEF